MDVTDTLVGSVVVHRWLGGPVAREAKPCTKCGGRGVLTERNDEQCDRCRGSGKEPLPPMNE